MEKLEHDLAALNEKEVVVVRKGNGNQSESYFAQLGLVKNSYPVIFQIHIPSFAMIFQVTDVLKLELTKDKPIIRLKGPSDYVETYHTTH
jgi:hypothetical protein